ncbi:Branched-chain amino acid transport system / permease component [Neomoorella glycerini]|uniref:Branched-chain amino acid transport system / permease component n=1 Tax=Neomoorella glycerini TaxID=55779 RepID=A0A6I5ZRH0_9FIRM|nr:ABC transporter permease [Moorella glycerini]QGP92279.1 Branched-chain amino acid transport system / permease component [Moorella glycerini]
MAAILAAVSSLDFLIASLRMTTPLLLAAMGDIYAERTGVLNIGLESMMLFGAFGSFILAYYSGNPYTGLLAAIVLGLIMGILHAFFTVTLRCDQVITAVGENILALGITSTLYRTIIGVVTQQPESPGLPQIPIPFLHKIPILGSLLFDNNILTYAALLMVPVTYIILFHTTWGLKIRAVGEHPRAADTLGINVYLVRYLCIIISGILASLGGASLTVGGLRYFLDNMTAGRGFIAFAAVIFGRYNPIGAFFATLLFGVTDAFQLRMQAIGIPVPHHIFLMLPYVVTLAALVFLAGPAFVPRSQGIPYIRDER